MAAAAGEVAQVPGEEASGVKGVGGWAGQEGDRGRAEVCGCIDVS